MTGQELRRRRLALNLSQTDVAELVGESGPYRRQIVYRWEAGLRSVPPACAILLDQEFARREKIADRKARRKEGARH